MHQGRIENVYDRVDATPENIVAAASGCALPQEEAA
jgi:rhamnose transport system ATP-binding protein